MRVPHLRSAFARASRQIIIFVYILVCELGAHALNWQRSARRLNPEIVCVG